MNDINQEDEITVEAEEWNPNKVYTAGEYFTIGKELYKVIVDHNYTCRECDFYRDRRCRSAICYSAYSDNGVIFTLSDTLEEE